MLRNQRHDQQPSIRMPGIASAVATRKLLVESIDPIDAADLIGVLQISQDLVSFGIHIGTDMVRDLTRGMTESHLMVESGSADPQRISVRIEFRRTPETNVMTLARVLADRLLESQILLA